MAGAGGRRVRRPLLAGAAALIAGSLGGAVLGLPDAAGASPTTTHPPTLSAITPTTGIAGTTVTLTGTYLSTETAVHFGKALAATVTVKSADKLLAVAPAGKGTAQVSVTTPTGTSNSEPFTYKVVHPPTLSAITPTTGIAGTTVTLTGTYLSTETAVHFGKALARTVTVKSTDKLLAVAPAGKGTIKVWVKTPTGTSNSEPFTYKAPTLTSLYPKAGHPGATLTLRGTGFSATATVDFAGSALNGVILKGATALSVVVPTLAGVKKKTTEPVVVHTAAGTSQTLSFAYEPPPALKVTTTSLPAFVSTQQQSYGPVTLTSSGGTPGAKTWSVGAGFPAGLSLTASSGVISGRPDKPSTQEYFDDTFHFTVTVKDAGGKTATKALTLTVVDDLNYILATTPAVASLDSPYSASFTAFTEVVPPYKTTHATDWTQSGLPPGLSITSYWGTVTGTPTEAGTFPVVVSDSYGGGFFATAAFTLTVQGLHITTTTLAGYTSTFFTQSTTGPTTLQVATATGFVLWSASGLPGGLYITADTGQVRGIAGVAGAAVGTYTFTATAKDEAGATTSRTVTVPITQGQLSIDTSKIVPANLDTPYSAPLLPLGRLRVTNESSSTPTVVGLDWTVWSATGLPTGLTVTRGNGTISGTPTVAGTFKVTATLMNAEFYAIAVFTLTVSAFHITTATLPNATTMSFYAQSLQAAGGTGADTWSVGPGLPPGMTFFAPTTQIVAALVTGLPGAAEFPGTYHFIVTAKDAAGTTASRTVTLTVTQGSFTITPVATQTAHQGQSYSLQLWNNDYIFGVANRNTPASTAWFATGLPPGLHMTPGHGVISGTPTQAGVYQVTARTAFIPGGPLWASEQFTLDVTGAPQLLSVTPPNLKAGQWETATVAGSWLEAPFKLTVLSALTVTPSHWSKPMPTTVPVYTVLVHAVVGAPATTFTTFRFKAPPGETGIKNTGGRTPATLVLSDTGYGSSSLSVSYSHVPSVEGAELLEATGLHPAASYAPTSYVAFVGSGFVGFVNVKFTSPATNVTLVGYSLTVAGLALDAGVNNLELGAVIKVLVPRTVPGGAMTVTVSDTSGTGSTFQLAINKLIKTMTPTMGCTTVFQHSVTTECQLLLTFVQHYTTPLRMGSTFNVRVILWLNTNAGVRVGCALSPATFGVSLTTGLAYVYIPYVCPDTPFDQTIKNGRYYATIVTRYGAGTFTFTLHRPTTPSTFTEHPPAWTPTHPTNYTPQVSRSGTPWVSLWYGGKHYFGSTTSPI